MAEKKGTESPHMHPVPMSPCGKVTPLSLLCPYLFHTDHFANADVQPGWDHILWL